MSTLNNTDLFLVQRGNSSYKIEYQELQALTGTGVHCDIRNYYTDDWTDAFNACLAANGAVYFPTGTYNITGVIGSTNRSVYIYGDGSGQSIINFTNGGFNFVGQQTVDNYDTFIIKNIGITGTGTNAVRLEYTNNGGVNQKAHCEDVAVTGTWTTGFRLLNTDLSTFDNCSVYRPVGYEGVGVEVSVDDDSGGGTDPVNIRFNNWQIAGLDTAFKVNSQSEGIYFHDNLIIACRFGIDLEGNVSGNEAAEPYYVIRGNNIDVIENCLKLDGVMQCIITDNSFYKFQSGPSNNWTGIIMDGNSFDNIIGDNVFNGNVNDPTTDGLDFTGIQLNRSVNTTITNNSFISLESGIKFARTNQCISNSLDNNHYRVVFLENTGIDGNGLFSEYTPADIINSASSSVEQRENLEYRMINGPGVTIYDSANPNGFLVTRDVTRSTLQSLRSAVAKSTDFESLKAAFESALMDL